MNACRVLLDPPASGAWNMAVDEALLQQTPSAGTPVFRLYRWQEATLSLGYFQRSADARRFGDLPQVRRLSGGGAIVHHHELTYSLCLPREHELGRQANCLYRRMHEGISNALAALEVKVVRRGALKDVAQNPSPEPFLCFLRQSEDDLGQGLAGNFRKVVGSAQRRRRGSLLQHGSLILATSPHAPEVVGLREATGIELEMETLQEKVVRGVLGSLGLRVDPSQLADSERELATRLAQEKYAARWWNARRSSGNSERHVVS